MVSAVRMFRPVLGQVLLEQVEQGPACGAEPCADRPPESATLAATTSVPEDARGADSQQTDGQCDENHRGGERQSCIGQRDCETGTQDEERGDTEDDDDSTAGLTHDPSLAPRPWGGRWGAQRALSTTASLRRVRARLTRVR
jgi:hypothetical protein